MTAELSDVRARNSKLEIEVRSLQSALAEAKQQLAKESGANAQLRRCVGQQPC